MRLSAHGVSLAYGARTLADRLDLTVSVGEAVAVIGPSGVGKSTLLGLLGGALTPDDGDVVVEPGGLPPSDHVSWVLQTLNVLTDRSVHDNVLLGTYADASDRGSRAERVQAALDAVGLGTRGSDPIRVLSGGEVQRVVIARALAGRRPFILADEPTGQLDPATTREVASALLATRADRGVVVVTHDPAVAAGCDRRLTLGDGRLTAWDEA